VDLLSDDVVAVSLFEVSHTLSLSNLKLMREIICGISIPIIVMLVSSVFLTEPFILTVDFSKQA
jgi:hypothetical protein